MFYYVLEVVISEISEITPTIQWLTENIYVNRMWQLSLHKWNQPLQAYNFVGNNLIVLNNQQFKTKTDKQ